MTGVPSDLEHRSARDPPGTRAHPFVLRREDRAGFGITKLSARNVLAREDGLANDPG